MTAYRRGGLFLKTQSSESTDMSYAIKELGVGGVLDQAIRVTKENLGVLLPVTFCLLVPLQIIMGLAQLAMTPQFSPDANPEEMVLAQQSLLPFMIVTWTTVILVGFIAQPITQAALIHSISELYLGNRPSLGQSFSKGLSRFLPLLGTSILYGLAVAGGMILLIIPGIIALIWFWLYQNVVVLEKQAGTKALGRSRELMKSNFGKAIGVSFVVFVMMFGFTALPQFVPQPHVAVILTGLIQGVALALSTAVSVVFYFSCLCQHENFDLQRLAATVGSSEDPADAEPALGL